ncbi:MAG: hypothetical protein HC844_06595 [Tabrizicola sp.]|nr:hypothetical protein [Tabrizicola sp.]
MRRILLVTAMVLFPAAGRACTVLAPFAVETLPTADIILVGEVTSFEMMVERPGAALVSVRVTEVIKGRAGEDMVLVWNGGLASGPHEEAAKGSVLIGAANPGRAVPELSQDARQDLPMILQPLCGVASIRPATRALIAEVKALVAPS